MRRASSTASRRSSGRSISASRSAEISTRRAPSDCSSCISRFFCDLLGASGSVSGRNRDMTGCYDTGFPAAIPMAKAKFSYALDTLRSIAADVLARAKSGGASGCETEVSEGYGQTVTVRMGEVETIEYNRDKGIGVTVYVGQQKGYASTSDFSPKAVADTV